MNLTSTFSEKIYNIYFRRVEFKYNKNIYLIKKFKKYE